jgi:hypothetical protein
MEKGCNAGNKVLTKTLKSLRQAPINNALRNTTKVVHRESYCISHGQENRNITRFLWSTVLGTHSLNYHPGIIKILLELLNQNYTMSVTSSLKKTWWPCLWHPKGQTRVERCGIEVHDTVHPWPCSLHSTFSASCWASKPEPHLEP